MPCPKCGKLAHLGVAEDGCVWTQGDEDNANNTGVDEWHDFLSMPDE